MGLSNFLTVYYSNSNSLNNLWISITNGLGDGDRLIIAGRVLVVEKMDHNRVSSILLLPPERKENEFAMESGVDA